MKSEIKHYKMKLTTYKRIRRNFKAQRGETCAEYFERLSKFLDQRGKRWGFEE